MVKHSFLFATSVVPMPLVGTYKLVNNTDKTLTFKHIDSQAIVQISPSGRLLFQRAVDVGFFYTYIADIQGIASEGAWHCTFTYFDVELLIQRVGTSMKVGELALVENINTSVVSNLDTEIL